MHIMVVEKITAMRLLYSLVIGLGFSAFSWGSSPKIIAHRGGCGNYPENTLFAFERSLSLGVGMIEMDVQLSKDKVPVLFHPRDLSQTTNGQGAVSDFTLAELKKLDAGYRFGGVDQGFPYRGKGMTIPTLAEALTTTNPHPVMLDMKAYPAEDLVKIIGETLTELQAWDRVIFYSTDPAHLDILKRLYPQAKMFEKRNNTRLRLLVMRNQGRCVLPTQEAFVGFDMEREMKVEEVLTLGVGHSTLTFEMWNPESVACTRSIVPNAQVVFFGVNTKESYDKATELKADAVLTDVPALFLKR